LWLTQVFAEEAKGLVNPATSGLRIAIEAPSQPCNPVIEKLAFSFLMETEGHTSSQLEI
jgi:hypothetical protein